jgi:hypothetical protein
MGQNNTKMGKLWEIDGIYLIKIDKLNLHDPRRYNLDCGFVCVGIMRGNNLDYVDKFRLCRDII